MKINILSEMRCFLLLLICLQFASCSKEDLPAYEDALITKVGAYHRFITGDKDAMTGEFISAQKELTGEYSIDEENGVAAATFTIPAAGGKFSEEERAKVSLNNLVVYINVSTAARVTPIEGAPKLGTPADWTSPHKYKVMAANGAEKIWTVKAALSK